MHITSPRLYFRDFFILFPLIISLGIQGFLWWYTVGKMAIISEQAYLHYTIIFGIDRYGPRGMLYYPLIAGLGIVIVNTLISYFFYKSERFIGRLMVITTLIITIFLFIAQTLIVGLNI